MSPVGLRALVEREFLELRRDRRLLIGLLFCLSLAVSSAVTESERLKSIRREEDLISSSWKEDLRAQLDRREPVEVSSVRIAAPLSVLASGLEGALPQRFFSTKERLRYGEGRSSRASLEAVAGTFDFSYVVAAAMSLLCLVVTYDTVSGERAGGTLALLLTYPISRIELLFAKVLAFLLLAAIWLGATVLAVAGTMMTVGLPLGNGKRWLLFGLLAIVYLSVWVAIGVSVSAATKKPATSLLIALVIWALCVLIIPRVLPAIAGMGEFSERLVELNLREEQELTKLRREYDATMKQLVADFIRFGLQDPEKRKAFNNGKEAAQERLDLARRKLSDEVWAEQTRIERARERKGLLVSVVSPAAVFQAAAAEVAQTGVEQREVFLEAAREYHDRVGIRLAESYRLFVQMDGATGVGYSVSEKVDHLMIPFETRWASVGSTMRRLPVPLAFMLLYVAASFAIGYRRFKEIDPRG